MSVAQAVECYVAHFHAINYEYSNRLLPQISQYFVIHFPLITLQRIYPGIISYSCQIQAECSSRFHSNKHAIRSPRVLSFEISFCTQRFITFPNVFSIMLTSSYYAGKRYLKYFVQFSTDKCAKNGAPEHYRPERNTAYHQMFKHNRHKF